MLKTFLGMGATAVIAVAIMVGLNGTDHLKLDSLTVSPAAASTEAGAVSGSCCSAAPDTLASSCESISVGELSTATVAANACAPENCGTDACCGGVQTVAAGTELVSTSEACPCGDCVDGCNCCTSDEVSCEDCACPVCVCGGCGTETP